MGISSTVLALEDLEKEYNFLEAEAGINYLREKVSNKLKGRGKVVALDSMEKNTNTIFFTVEGKDSNSLLIAFDLAGIDVGVGSACSSGVSKPNSVLLKLGYSSKEASSGLRLSFEPTLNKSKAINYWSKIEAVLERVIKSIK